MEPEVKQFIELSRPVKKVRRVVSITPDHDAYLKDYNASELFGLLLDRFIAEQFAAKGKK